MLKCQQKEKDVWEYPWSDVGILFFNINRSEQA